MGKYKKLEYKLIRHITEHLVWETSMLTRISLYCGKLVINNSSNKKQMYLVTIIKKKFHGKNQLVHYKIIRKKSVGI